MQLAPAPLEPPATKVAQTDVVFTFSYLSWGAAERRGFCFPEDRLLLSLLDDERVGRLLVGDTLRSLPAKLLRDGLRGQPTSFPSDPRMRLISPTRLGPSEPTSIGGVRRAIRTYERSLAAAARQMGMEQPAVISGNPLVAGFGEFEWARAVTYYGFDDWSRSPLYRRWWPVYEASYELIRERGRRVGAVSSGLCTGLAPSAGSVLVQNGLEPTEWRGAPTPPASTANLGHPVLLYVGTLDYRLRIDWLTDLARSLPDATILLVGLELDPRAFDPLRGFENVIIHPAIEDRLQFAGLIRQADVGLIPHCRTPLTETIEPQKVWEYLAGGLPVVSTDLPPIRGIDPRVDLVDDEGDFTAAVRRALGRGRAGEDERLAFVEDNSWRARHHNLIGLAVS